MAIQRLSGCLLQLRLFFGQNGTFYRAYLKANAAVNAGIKINPVPAGAFFVFTRAFVNTGHGAGIDAIRNAFTNVGHNSVGHKGGLAT